MEFLLFLTQTDKEIVKLVGRAGFNIKENTLPCLVRPDFFGATNKKKKELILCTNNIKRASGFHMPNVIDEDGDATKVNIRETLRHEATHVAQFCNSGKVLKANETSDMVLNDYKRDSLTYSIRVSGNTLKEREAYWMENKPGLVKTMLTIYCL